MYQQHQHPCAIIPWIPLLVRPWPHRPPTSTSCLRPTLQYPCHQSLHLRRRPLLRKDSVHRHLPVSPTMGSHRRHHRRRLRSLPLLRRDPSRVYLLWHRNPAALPHHLHGPAVAVTKWSSGSLKTMGLLPLQLLLADMWTRLLLLVTRWRLETASSEPHRE